MRFSKGRVLGVWREHTVCRNYRQRYKLLSIIQISFQVDSAGKLIVYLRYEQAQKTLLQPKDLKSLWSVQMFLNGLV